MKVVRAQISLEFLLVFSFVLLVFLFLFALIASQRSTGLGEQTFSQLQLAAQNIATQIDTAFEAGTYSASVPIVNRIGAVPFNITLTSAGAVIASALVGTQLVQAIAYSMPKNIISNPAFKQGNGAYLIPIANGTINIASSSGQVCVDYACTNTSTQASSISLQSEVVHAALFNGYTANINIASSPSLNPSNTVTITAWISVSSYPSDNRNGEAVVGKSTQYELSVNALGNAVIDGVLQITPVYSTVEIPLNKWVFVAGGLNNDGVAFVCVDSICNSGSGSSEASLATSTNPLYIGYGTISSTSAFNGLIANVQLYNASLSSNQISHLYQDGIAGSPIPSANLVGWWPLSGNANDYSGNGNNGQALNVAFTPLSVGVIAWR